MITRGRILVSLVHNADRETLEYLGHPRYETTKGALTLLKKKDIENLRGVFGADLKENFICTKNETSYDWVNKNQSDKFNLPDCETKDGRFMCFSTHEPLEEVYSKSENIDQYKEQEVTQKFSTSILVERNGRAETVTNNEQVENPLPGLYEPKGDISKEVVLSDGYERKDCNKSIITYINLNEQKLQNCSTRLLRRHDENILNNSYFLQYCDSSPDPYADSGSAYSPGSNSVASNSTDDSDGIGLKLASNSPVQSNAVPIITPPPIPLLRNENQITSVSCSTVDTDRISEVSPLDSNTSLNSIHNNDGVIVYPSEKIDGKRIRDKGHSCYFCQSILYNNVARHLETQHGNETEVARILCKPKGSNERRKAFMNLVRYGDFYHNCNVLAVKRGQPILARRPNLQEDKYTTYSDYGPCPECLGFFLKKQIWHHLKYKCAAKTEHVKGAIEGQFRCAKGPLAESTALLNGILGNNVTPEFLKLVNQLRNDDVSNRCKEDDTIMRYGAFLFEKYSFTQSELIRQNMRQLGRLTVELKNQGEVFGSLNELLIPEKFDSIVNCTKVMPKTTRENPTVRPETGIPSLALKIGYAIKKCAEIERGQCLRKGDFAKNRKHIGFLQLLQLEWNIRISSNALSTLYARKKSAEDLLPLTSDLVKLNSFLESEIKKVKQNLTCHNYSKLVSLTLARIIIFYKRRSGETAKMTLKQYSSRPNWNDTGTQELKDALTPLENKLASNLVMIKITGKRGKIVPVILTKDVKDSIDLIVSKRVENRILLENPYVFAIPNTASSHYRGHDCLKRWCVEADLQSPDLVTSTKLRKYVATVCQIFNLSENEYDWLARHLGHDIRVHREFYRLQENAVELTKVGRLLLAVDQGVAHKFTGRKLSEINIQDFNDLIQEEDINDKKEQQNDEGEDNDNEVLGLDENMEVTSNTKNKYSRKGKINKKTWTSEEKELLLNEFKNLIKRGSLPGKERCVALMNDHKSLFLGRKWTDLKFYVKNHLTKVKKTSCIK